MEYRMFVEEFKRNPDTIWIMKPCGQAQGRGIFLINKLSQIINWKKDARFEERTANSQASAGTSEGEPEPEVEEYVVQRYVANPYLVGGKKFDMRIYCMVTSYRPLRAYLYRSAFARFSGVPFSMEGDAISNNVVHLTNVAIQKTADGYDPSKGCKWQMYQLKRWGARSLILLRFPSFCSGSNPL
jgi:tubulin polyglutamylase TTLL9